MLEEIEMTVNKDTYGFFNKNEDELVATLSKTFGIVLYRHFSPMVGNWYDCTDPKEFQKIMELIEEGRNAKEVQKIAAPPSPRIRFYLEKNDPEPGYTPPTYAEGHSWNLSVTSKDLTELEKVAETLLTSGLEYKLLKSVRS